MAQGYGYGAEGDWKVSAMTAILKAMGKNGNPSLSASESPDGKAKEWPLYDLENKQLMIFDEFNIHPEKESQRKILDWDRTYFLTKYYCL